MKRVFILVTLMVAVFFCNSFAKELSSQVYLTLPSTFNSPASADFDKDMNIYFTSPNFHNDALIKQGVMSKPAMPTIGKIDKNDKLTTWYTFKQIDMEPKSKKLAPMGIAFGPDGNAYVADMQMWFGGDSRIIRINVENGKAVSTSVVATGFTFPNAVVFKGDDMFVSDTVFKHEKGKKTISGLYKINIKELNTNKPLKIKSYVDSKNHDSHLFETFTSNGVLGFGANGLAIDGEGSIYTSLMENGSVVKTTMDKNNNKIKTTLFADGMIATDGFKWDKDTNKIYMTDLFANAVYSIDMDGKLELLVSNKNTTGSNGELDGPSELIVRDKKIIIMNFDAVFNDPRMLNKKADKVHTLSVIHLK